MTAVSPEDGLAGFRAELDQIDRQLIELLGRRFEIGREVALFKAANEVPVMQHGRVQVVLDRNAEAGEAAGIAPAFVRSLYQLIIDEMCRIEDEIVDAS